ncbi:MAG: universal stress protein [Bacteroidia bacterium]|nr:universal stress protein [Bacteroidia bacterium]
MKTILVPTDFSSYSENAMNMAMLLARSLNARLLMCHVIQVPLAIGEIPYALLEKEKNELKQEAEIKMKALALKIEHAGGISYQTKVLDGELLTELLEIITTEKIDLVIMGTKGVKNIQDVILGSTTEQLISNSQCPVMAVPADVHFNTSMKRLTYATDYHKSDLQDLLQLIEIASSLKAQVNVLHVSGDEINAEEEVKLMSDFMKEVSEKCSYNNLSFQILHGNNVLQKLQDYLNEESTDVLITSTHHRSLVERLFGKSNTLSLVKKSKIPVIAFHYNSKN